MPGKAAWPGNPSRRVFSSLSIRNYRLFFFGQLVSISGTWMQTVAQAFLVLQLSNSGTVLGLTVAARFGPMFLFGPWGGLIADRTDKRRMLLVTQALSGLLALAFGILITTGAIRIWTVFVLAAALGFVNVFDNPARQSLISELVPPDQLRNAVTLNSVSVNVARILGGVAGGTVAAAIGLALCFDINAISFVAVITTLALMSGDQIARTTPSAREKGEIRAGLRYVRTTPELAIPILMVAIIGTLAWEFEVSLPLLAKKTFDGDASTYAAMVACMGVGAVVGGLISATRSIPKTRGLALAAIGWGTAITVAALAPSLAIDYVVLLFVGYGSITFNSLAKTTIQLAARPQMRGRVMALWALAWQGSTPIGGPIIGAIGEGFGARWSLLAGGIPTLIIGLVCFPILTRVDARLHAERTAVGLDAGPPIGSAAASGVADPDTAPAVLPQP